MNTYRVTKYDPQYRDGGKYLRDEWTDYSDIGKTFRGEVLTESEYLTTEQNYIHCIIELLQTAGVQSLCIEDLEIHQPIPWKNKQCLSAEKSADIIRDCLRNKCWCRLTEENQAAYVHFGYDYYTYAGIDLSHKAVEEICKKYALFGEVTESPYCQRRKK